MLNLNDIKKCRHGHFVLWNSTHAHKSCSGTLRDQLLPTTRLDGELGDVIVSGVVIWKRELRRLTENSSATDTVTAASLVKEEKVFATLASSN